MTPYYADSLVTIYHGRMEDVLPSLFSIGLVFTSPPYNLGTSTGGGLPGKLGHYRDKDGVGTRGGGGRHMGKWSGGALANGYGLHDDAMPHDGYVRWQQECLRLCWTALSADGAIFYNHKPRVLGGTLVSPLAYIPPELPVRQ